MSRHMGGQHGIHLPLLIGFAHSDCSALQQPHGHISQQHRHLLGPGHAAPAPVIIGHVHRGHTRAVSSAGSGNARCPPCRSSWCRRPQSSALQRPPHGPGARRTGWELGIAHSSCRPGAPLPSHGGRRGPGTPRGGTPHGPAQLTRQMQVMHALLGSLQLSPSATLRPSASTTHSWHTGQQLPGGVWRSERGQLSSGQVWWMQSHVRSWHWHV